MDTAFDAVRMKKMYPHLTNAYIGRRLGVGRERIRQIFRAKGLPTRAINPTHYCLHCNGEIEGRIKVHKGRCHFEYYEKLLTCYGCGKEFYRSRGHIALNERRNQENHFHSVDCYHKNHA